MKNDAKNSVSGSAMTSPTGSPESDPAPGKSEAEFLQDEVAKARAAITGALSDLGRNLKATADPHALTRDHPWIAISTAAVAGFAAALTLVPSKEQQALAALAKLERARHASQVAPSHSTSDKEAAVEGGLLGTVGGELLKMVRPLLTSLLSAGISRATGANGSPVPESNGTSNRASNGASNGASNDHKSEEEDIASPS